MQSVHGGERDRISRFYNLNRDEIIDFSGNINPLGLSETIKNSIISNINKITTYPDVQYYDLKTSIGEYVGAPSEFIIPGSGATDVISAYINALKPENALIIYPAYSEYAREIIKTGGVCRYYPLIEDHDFSLDETKLAQMIKGCNLLVMCNPNNPTGAAVKKDVIKKILEICESIGVSVMIDETYIEFTDERQYSSVPLTKEYGNLFIVRGTAKFFACPGLRLGYGITSNSGIIEKITAASEPWKVNILAAIAGEVMFKDESFINATKKHISAERTRFINRVAGIRELKAFRPTANFMLIKILKNEIDARDVFETLIRKNILIRDCSEYEFLGGKFFRCCFLGEKENLLLLDELDKIFLPKHTDF